MRALSIPLAAALAGAFVAAPARGHCPCDCVRDADDGRAGEAEQTGPKDEPSGGVVASVELGVGLDDAIQTLDASGETPMIAEREAESTLVVTPVVEWAVGRSVFVGGGLRMAQTEESSAGFPVRRSIVNPVVRLRLSFPVWGRLSADALFDAGIAFWSSPGQRGLVGWSQAAAAGPAVRLTERLVAYANAGFYGASARTGSAGAQPQAPAAVAGPEPTALRSTQLVLGVRTRF